MLTPAQRNFLNWIVPANVIKLLRTRRQDATVRRAYRAPVETNGFDYLKAVDWLVNQGCERLQVLDGSMPPDSLDFSWKTIAAPLKSSGSPIRGLHIGNFLGVSLASFTSRISQCHRGSTMVSIDPNIPHRGIQYPARLAIGLLNQFGLEENSLVLTGYSLEKSRMDDAIERDSNGQLVPVVSTVPSCARQLPQLAALCPSAFDFAVIDGNHEADYLERELETLYALVRPGGFLILDDVGTWDELKPIYAAIDSNKYVRVASDGRVGIVQKTS